MTHDPAPHYARVTDHNSPFLSVPLSGPPESTIWNSYRNPLKGKACLYKWLVCDVFWTALFSASGAHSFP